ncbi:MAG: hypothetical protein IPO88_08955 [Nannocystis sp.]|uniref:hypothetical protein n=1 Tax=Nannocystis sp. TaxID=1962667 RepID=UPI0024266E24|nr:hypothetical protein [Nannocystis sp.]MBK9753622.1 hypothetical protein [Nannocystis sp.]
MTEEDEGRRKLVKVALLWRSEEDDLGSDAHAPESAMTRESSVRHPGAPGVGILNRSGSKANAAGGRMSQSGRHNKLERSSVSGTPGDARSSPVTGCRRSASTSTG